MSARKIAISIDPRLLSEADELARQRKLSRSGLISQLLAIATRRAKDRAITASLDRVYADPLARAEQARLTRDRYAAEVFGDAEDQW